MKRWMLMAVLTASSVAWGQATQPATGSGNEPTTKPVARKKLMGLPGLTPATPATEEGKKLLAELNGVAKELSAVVPSITVLRELEKREAVRGEATKLLEKWLATHEAFGKVERSFAASQNPMRLRYATMLAALGGDPAVDPETKNVAGLVARFLVMDEKGQLEQLSKVEEGLGLEDGDKVLGSALSNIYHLQLSASGVVGTKLMTVMMKSTSPAVKQIVMLAKSKDVRLGLVGKPLVIRGTLPDGKEFSTEQWMGKVVLIDFWATWCGPCRAELPRLRQMYDKYHGQGLEVLGISSDRKMESLKAFLEKDPSMVWPTLVDLEAIKEGKPNPMLAEMGVLAIPQMFVIDRKGVLRSVEARAEMETLIPKLLAERVGD